MSKVCSKPVDEKRQRAEKTNELLRIIGSLGRHFFRHGDRFSHLEVSKSGHIFFVDAYSLARIYTHYEGDWRRFNEGGTMQAIIEALRDYIRTGEPLRVNYFGPFPDWYSGGDPWGYKEDMLTVVTAAIKLGIYRPQCKYPPSHY